MTNIVDKAGKYRVIDNGSGGFGFEVQIHGQWRSFGSEVSRLKDATVKLHRLAGFRDTETTVDEWAKFYRVNA